MSSRILCLMLVAACGITSCTKESTNSSNTRSGERAGAETLPENLAIVGTVQLDTEVQAAGTGDDAVAGRSVQLVNDDNEIIAEGLTVPGGAFTIALSTAAMGLTQSAASAPKIAKIRSLFLLPGEKADAVGTRQPILISPADVETGSDGASKLNAGAHAAKKVGAIVGQIKLETNESPIGIDVYIPGTTQVAKTDADGRFLIGFLQPGVFELRADKDGFNSIEWREVVVALKSTTHLDQTIMTISKGPKIESFGLLSLDEETGVAALKVKLSGASRYRIGKVPDFSDAQFQPVDANASEFSLNQIVPGGLRIISFYLEAIDSDGLSVKSSITIDREAPYLGSLELVDGDGLINSTSVQLKPFVTNGTKMRFSETLSGLKTAQWNAYSTSHVHVLTGTNEGTRTLYVEYADDAGNTTGAQGEIYVKFTLDTTAPDHKRVELITPASPTGAFNTPLSWQSSFAETVEYDIEIFDNANYTGTAVRQMTTKDSIIITNPAIASAGTYYWRVRARDLAGNASEWVISGSEKSFILKVLREAYQAKKEHFGTEGKDTFLGRNMIAVGDLTGDGLTELAVSIPAAESTACANCSVVRIVNPVTGATLATITEGLDRHEGYGNRMVSCDLNNDGKDELIVSAPNAMLRRNGYNYANTGAVYVYNMTTFQKITERKADLGAIDPPPGYGCWNDWDPVRSVSVFRCGNQMFASALDGLDPAMATDSSRLYGQSLACARKSGADHLVVGEPQYQSMGMPVGRVHEYALSGNTLTSVAAIEGVNNWSRYAFSVAHLKNFNWAGGTCGAGETLAVGAPDDNSGGSPGQGRVYLYQKSSNAWALCDSIAPMMGDNWETGNFGARLFNLGDIDADGSFEELAVSNFRGMMGGLVRIFGGSTGELLKSLKIQSDTANELGYIVAPAGDFDEDGKSEIAIAAPRARVNGVFEAGRIMIYKWDDINADDMGSDGAPMLELTYRPKGGAFLGATYVPIVASGNINTKPLSMFTSSPGKSSGDGCAPPNPCGGGGPAMMPQGSPGAYLEFSFLKLAPSLPLRLTGSSTAAGLGASLAAVEDIDGDNASDFIIGQSGARCAGRPYGALSIYSVLDGVFSRHICSGSPRQKLGKSVVYSPSSKGVIFSVESEEVMPAPSQSLDLYFATFRNLMTIVNFNDIEVSNNSQVKKDVASNKDYFVTAVKSTSMPSPSDHILVGDPTRNMNTGRVQLVRAMGPMPINLSEDVRWDGQPGDMFGASVDFAKDISNPMMGGGDDYDIIVGVPGRDVGGVKGAVYVFDKSEPGPVTPTAPGVYIALTAKDMNGAGEDALEGFGNFVLGLPNFGDHEGATTFEAESYIYIANTNMREGSSTLTPEYYIVAIKNDGSHRIVKHEVGTAGSMLGGYARLLPDINGDGVPDLAISHPGGTGQLGATGQVKILSGKGLTTTDENDDVMQVFYNPDASSSNFGVAFEYGDITGDAVADFVIGANEFDTAVYQDAGAVYIFPMDSVR